MRRALLCLSVVLSACNGIPPNPTTPDATPALTLSVAAIVLTASPSSLPATGGTAKVNIYTAGHPSGAPQAPHTRVILSASTGSLKQTEVVTDWTGNASTDWTGTQSGEITATANGITTRALIAVVSTPVATPPNPAPPNPTPPIPLPPSGPVTVEVLPPARIYATELTEYQAAIRYPSVVRDDRIEWDFTGDGQTDKRGRFARWTYNVPGAQAVTVKATADDGGTGTGGVRLTVRPVDEYTVRVAITPETPNTGDTVTFSAVTTSRTGVLPPLTYTWSLSDGSTGSGASISRVFATAGSRTATATARALDGRSVSASGNVTVTMPPFVASLRASDPRVALGTPVTLIASASGMQPGEAPQTYTWFMEGQIRGVFPQDTISYSFATVGTHTARVTIRTTLGRTQDASVVVLVQ